MNATIDSFVKKFTNEKIDYQKIYKGFYLIDENLKEIIEFIDDEKPFSAGLFLGEMKGKEFIPSIALIDWISKRSEKKVFINKKAEWLFLCGRDLFSESILKGYGKKNSLTLVQNEKDENLGYGEITNDVTEKNKNKKKVVVKNSLDKGFFLRKERKKA